MVHDRRHEHSTTQQLCDNFPDRLCLCVCARCVVLYDRDEWIEKRSPRIQPLGTHTTGWTGNKASRAPYELAKELPEFKKVLEHTQKVLALLEAKTKELLPAVEKAGKDEKALSAALSALSLSSLLPKDELSFVQSLDNMKMVMNILNVMIDDPKLFALTQTFLRANLDLVIHSLRYDAELHISMQNIFSLIFNAGEFNRYYKVRTSQTHAG
jgi:hypothetical protein